MRRVRVLLYIGVPVALVAVGLFAWDRPLLESPINDQRITSDPIPHGPAEQLVAINATTKQLVVADPHNFRVIGDFGKGEEIAFRRTGEVAEFGEFWFDLKIVCGGALAAVRVEESAHSFRVDCYRLPDLTLAFRFKRPDIADILADDPSSFLVEERDRDSGGTIFWRVGRDGRAERFFESPTSVVVATFAPDRSVLALVLNGGKVVVIDGLLGTKVHEWAGGDRRVWYLAASKTHGCLIEYRRKPRTEIVGLELATGQPRWSIGTNPNMDHRFLGVIDETEELIIEEATWEKGRRHADIVALSLRDGRRGRTIASDFNSAVVEIDKAAIHVIERPVR